MRWSFLTSTLVSVFTPTYVGGGKPRNEKNPKPKGVRGGGEGHECVFILPYEGRTSLIEGVHGSFEQSIRRGHKSVSI
jgi:hypothetical protein